MRRNATPTRRPDRAVIRRAFTRRGFTMVELLIVVGIIILLLSLVLVALTRASGYAAGARTSTLMRSMAQGFEQFERDHGQLPPVLGDTNPGDADDLRNLMETPGPGDFTGLQSWFSITTPAEYLVGYGGAGADGHSGPGIRSPGSDGVWGATLGNGLLADRNPPGQGKVYGPYLELSDDRLLGSVDDAGNIHVAGDAGFLPEDPKVILDYWGEPIRYYRRHPLAQSRNGNERMDLGDVVLLRPWQITDGSEATARIPDASGSRATSTALKSAPFALFSTGPDRTGNQLYRRDDPELQNDTSNANEDNIVEIGP